MAKRASLLDQKDTFFKESDKQDLHPIDRFTSIGPGQAVDLPVDRIQPDPNQPRKSFSEDAIRALATSIKEKGLLQPISVRKADDSFLIVAGERRWRAHKKAKLPKIRAFITNITDPNEAFEIALIENLQREDLEPLEEAAGIAELMKRKKYRQNQAAQVTGRSKTQVSKLLKLNQLPPPVKEKVATSQLSRDQLFQISSQETPEAMIRLTDRIVRMGLNVQETRKAAKEELDRKPHPLIGQLKRFEKTLTSVQQDQEIEQIQAEDREAIAGLLSSVTELAEQLQSQLQS